MYRDLYDVWHGRYTYGLTNDIILRSMDQEYLNWKDADDPEADYLDAFVAQVTTSFCLHNGCLVVKLHNHNMPRIIDDQSKIQIVKSESQIFDLISKFIIIIIIASTIIAVIIIFIIINSHHRRRRLRHHYYNHQHHRHYHHLYRLRVVQSASKRHYLHNEMLEYIFVVQAEDK